MQSVIFVSCFKHVNKFSIELKKKQTPIRKQTYNEVEDLMRSFSANLIGCVTKYEYIIYQILFE